MNEWHSSGYGTRRSAPRGEIRHKNTASPSLIFPIALIRDLSALGHAGGVTYAVGFRQLRLDIYGGVVLLA